MTRDSEIKEAAAKRHYFHSDTREGKIAMTSFMEGARWADSTMIDNACKWLKDYAHIYVSETTGDLNEDDLINAFRKAMKGE